MQKLSKKINYSRKGLLSLNKKERQETRNKLVEEGKATKVEVNGRVKYILKQLVRVLQHLIKSCKFKKEK